MRYMEMTSLRGNVASFLPEKFVLHAAYPNSGGLMATLKKMFG